MKNYCYVILTLMLVVSCECKDMHLRRLPEEKDVVFKGEVKAAPSQKTKPYVPNERRYIQLHLSSKEKEAEEATFRILSWEVAGGKKGTLDTSSIRLGDNTLAYTPYGPGTHKLTIKVAVEGEEASAKNFHYTVEAPAAKWYAVGHADEEGNITLTINNAPEAWHHAHWHIQSTRWSRGLQGRITNNLTQVQAGETTFPITLQAVVLEELPKVYFTLQGPDRGLQRLTFNLRKVCIAKLEETYSEAQTQDNEAIRRQAATYQSNLTGNTRATAQRTLNALLDESTRLRETTERQLASLVSNLNVLRTEYVAGLDVLEARRNALRRERYALNASMCILQPMVSQLNTRDQGRVDP